MLKFAHLPVTDLSGATQNFEQLSSVIWPQVVSELPSNPVDGQEACFQTAEMAEQGVVWQLRYRAGSSSAHKWEFVGGAQLTAGPAPEASFLTTSRVLVALSGGPKLVVPATGIYDLHGAIRSFLNREGAATELVATFAVKGTQWGAAFFDFTARIQDDGVLLQGLPTRAEIKGGEELTILVMTSNGTEAGFMFGHLELCPVRLG